MKLLKTLLVTAIAASTAPAIAYEAGDIIVKAGVAFVQPKDDNLNLGGGNVVEVQPDQQLGLTANYFLTPRVSVELLAATPFKHDIELNGEKVATTKHLPPTISLQYYPLDASSRLQPYVGLGLNHTFFFDEDGIVEHLGKSTGVAYSAGVNYDLNKQWLASVTIWKMDIDTELNDSGEDVEIDPTVVLVSAGYKF